MKLAFPEHDLVLEDCEGGIRVTQHQKTYLARKWRLTEQIVSIAASAIRAQLCCFWQEGHPGGSSSHHISFSFSHAPASWIFCIGDGAGAPQVKKVTISKKVRGLFVQSGLNPFWENAGGKNFSIFPEQLPEFLALVAQSGLKNLLSDESLGLNRRQVRQVTDFQSEHELEDCVATALENGGAKLIRQKRFRASHFPDSMDIPDLIIDADGQIIVIELKLYRAIEPDLIQLARYVNNAELRAAFANRPAAGVLITARFDRIVRDNAKAMRNCSLYTYAGKTGLPLRLEQGTDSLGRFMAQRTQRLAPGFQSTSFAPRSLA